MSDDFDDDKTPERAKRTPRVLTDSEVMRHRRTWVRGVPVVRPEPDEEVTAPLELLLNGQLDVDDYAQVEALRRSNDDVYVLLMNLARAISRHRDKERSGQREVEKQVLEAIKVQAARMDEFAKRMDTQDLRVKPIEDTFKSVRGFSKAAVAALVTTVLGSGIAIITTMKAQAKEEGAAAERDASQSRRLDSLEAINAEKLKQLHDGRSRPDRRDYDYDITPRPFVAPKREP